MAPDEHAAISSFLVLYKVIGGIRFFIYLPLLLHYAVAVDQRKKVPNVTYYLKTEILYYLIHLI